MKWSEKAKRVLSIVAFIVILIGAGLSIYGAIVLNNTYSLIAIGLSVAGLIADDIAMRD